MTTRKPRVLVFADYYLPGFRAGGPIRSISNTIGRLAPDIDFFVVTRDHDTDGARYPGIEPGRWTPLGDGPVLYAPRFTQRVVERSIADTGCDAIWLNSFFSRASLRVLLARRLDRVRQPILLAPRGELSAGALTLKRWRKSVGIQLLQQTGSLRSIDWLASSDHEADDIRRIIGDVPITRVPESVSEPRALQSAEWPRKEPGRLRLVWASRISAMKNLQFLLGVLAQCQGTIELDLIGPVDDEAYWAACQRQIGQLPSRVTVSPVGELAHDELMRRLPVYDMMVLPSLGENFGHIVAEAWAAGCPVLVSDRTPWRNLAIEGVGWDLPLEQPFWVHALQRCLSMTDLELRAMRGHAMARARRVWREGLRGDEALRQLIFRLANRSVVDRRPDRLQQDEIVADANPCR